MRICLVRHAIAEERGSAWPDDSLRPLTADGRKKMRAAAAGIARLVQPTIILTSPLTRAVQTAEILGDTWDLHRFHVSDALAEGDDENLLADILSLRADALAAVGHEPFISATLSFLLTGDRRSVSAPFGKGAAACVEFEGEPRAGEGTLLWFMQPSALRLLGRR